MKSGESHLIDEFLHTFEPAFKVLDIAVINIELSVLWNVVDSSGGDPRANIACHVSSTHQKKPARKIERNEWIHHGNGLAFWNTYVCSEAKFLGH